MGEAWLTKRLGRDADYVSPGGASEIRLLPSFAEGEIVHAHTQAGATSVAAALSGLGELFFVLRGEGELWRSTGDLDDLTRLVPDRCVSIPPGVAYQYRAESDLDMLVATAPRWSRENWAETERAYWDPAGSVQASPTSRPGPWTTSDLGTKYDYLAPDGSEIRLLPTFDSGGLAHCTLPRGKVTSAVRHRTVKEVWYVLSGAGELWRSREPDEEVVELVEGTCATIPTAVSFQFRTTSSEPLVILIGTFPRWPGPDEAEPVSGHWPAAER